MAGFKTHIGTSTVLGVGYGTVGYLYGMPLSSAVVAGGLCSVSGMLPDLDSDNGVPVREMFSFGAAIVPMLMVDRFERLGWTHEMIVLATGVLYVMIRFGVAELFKRYTVHRGMWHSIPAAVLASLLALLVCSCHHQSVQLYKAGAVFLGFISHLVLDEIWSISLKGGRLRIKKSFGTALKFWSPNSTWANISCYGKLAIVAFLAYHDPAMMKQYQHQDHIPHTATQVINDLTQPQDPLLR